MSDPAVPLPLDDWLYQAAARGLHAGLHERLAAHELLRRLHAQGRLPAGETEQRRLLAPLLCSTPEQQSLYAQWLDESQRTTTPAGKAPETETRAPPQHDGVAAMFALLLAALVCWGAWLAWQRAYKQDIPTPASAASAPVVPASGGLRIEQPRFTAEQPLPIIVPQHPFAADQPELPAWAVVLRHALTAVAVLSALFTAWRLWRHWRRRRLYVEAGSAPTDRIEQHTLHDPLARPLAPSPHVLVPVARSLRQRVLSDTQLLDARATIRATIRQGGLLAPQWARRSATPEYLALIDRGGPHDQQSRYHEAMVSALQGRGVVVEVYFYDASPAHGCWRLRGAPGSEGRARHDSVPFATLIARHPRHRLLMFGDARATVQADSGQPAAWTQAVGALGQRAWFTPLPVASWGAVEAWVTDSQGLDFLLLPMEAAALQTLAQWLASGRAELRQDPAAPLRYPPMLQGDGAAWVHRQVSPPPEVVDQLLHELSDFLGPHRMHWLSACALFPSLSWPLTLALGRKLQAAREGPASEPDDAELALGAGALGALPWFRHGLLPHWLRLPLIRRLPPALETLLRDELMQRLERAANPGGDEIARVARLRGFLIGARGEWADLLLLRFLEPALAPQLAQWLPDKLRRWLFPHDAILLGLRRSWAWAAALPMLFALLWVPSIWKAVHPELGLPLRSAAADPRLGADGIALARSPDGQFSVEARQGRNIVTIDSADGSSGRSIPLSAPLELLAVARWAPMAMAVLKGQGLQPLDLSRGVVQPAGGLMQMVLASAAAMRAQGDGLAVGLTDGEVLRLPFGQSSVQPAERRRIHERPVRALAWRPDGQQLASLDEAGSVQLWDDGNAATGTRLPRDAARSGTLGYSADGATLAIGRRNGTVELLDGRTAVTLGDLRAIAPAEVQALAFSDDGRRLAAGMANGQVAVWDIDSGQPLLHLATAAPAVRALHFGADGQTLLMLGSDGRAYRWGQASQLPQVAVLDCDGPAPAEWLSLLARQVSGQPDVRPFAISPALWTAWRHGPSLPVPRELLVPAGAEGEALGQALLGQLPTRPGEPAWTLRAVSGLRTASLNVCQTVAPPEPATPAAQAQPRLDATAWPQQRALPERRALLRTALARLGPVGTEQLIAEGDLVSDLQPVALAQAMALATAKDPGRPDERSPITQALRLAQAASPVTLQRQAAELYRLIDAAQGLGPVAQRESAGLAQRLLAVRGLRPEVRITLTDATRRPAANTLRQALQVLGFTVPAIAEPPAAGASAASEWRVMGRSDQGLARWLATAKMFAPLGLADLPLRHVADAGSAAAVDRYEVVIAAMAGLPPIPNGARFQDCPDETVCPWLRAIPAGQFTMGSPDDVKGGRPLEGPAHRVTIGRFALMEAEVTRGQFKAFVDETGYTVAGGCFTWTGAKHERNVAADWRAPGFDQTDSHPVVCVSWNDAQAYAAWLSLKLGHAFRLPTEAEWEYAARAGSRTRYSFGDSDADLCRYGNVADESAKANLPEFDTAPCNDGQVFTASVKQFARNVFGLYDMHGNAWEWVEDCWHNRFAGAPADGSPWVEKPCAFDRRVLRGGGWVSIPVFTRSAVRDGNVPVYRDGNLGFRLARTLSP
ncbi:SUMF1/EgtB/PvdO family nonheme iron enzyme [Ideonella sp. A 288]|uniref:SUMF1/EgtB/PvdO family nonheme iron enzyme n=1 Tax=Ideonella sp. A 288 TaxID=1962181 RepID=UPI000B4B0487|nr:SUMF1/EgtB/PvdO family nonheme iron enzyme [Ideonella sp. A 288]